MSTVTGRRPLVGHSTGQLWDYIVRYRGRFLLGLSCVVLTNAIALSGPWILKLAIDDLAIAITQAKLIGYGGAILGVALASALSRFGSRRVIIGASRAIEYDIRNAFFQQLQRLPAAYFQRNRTGDLMSRATNDLNAVRMMVGPAVMYTASTGLTFVVALGYMFSLNPRLTLVALVPLPVITAIALHAGRLIHERFEQIQAQLADLSAVTQEALAGVRVIRAYRQEQQELKRFERANREYVARNRDLIRLQSLFFPSMGLCMGLSELLVLWLGSRAVVAGRMSVGELVAFNSYLLMLAWPMVAFGWVTNLLQRGRASWSRMLDVLESVPAIDDSSATRTDVRPEDLTGALEFRNLSFRYANGHVPTTEVLHGLNLSVPAGATLGIVGRTGSGKSTLLSLVARLHDPPPGTVFIDGIDVRELPLGTLRRAIGFVPQEPFLFSATVAENVAFGGLTTEGVTEAAAIARLDADVAGFPLGYETRIGERGITLSGGQKQRTALARALDVDPRILVLDDALSAVDTQTEEEILQGLRAFRKGRTTLLVSHRVSAVRDADLIVVLEAGRMVEQGSHEQLLAQQGAYADLHRRQMLEEELARS